MNTATIVIIAIVVLYLIFAFLAAVFKGLAEISGQSVSGFKKAATYIFGKKYLKRQPQISKELLPDSDPLPAEDTQLLRLKYYEPESSHIKPIMAIMSDFLSSDISGGIVF